MNRIIHFIRDHYSVIYRGVLILFSVFAITYLFPRQGKFKYEFQKGKPWQHEVLIAPFDFPVYKTDNNYAAEKDSVLDDFKPYFDHKVEVKKKALDLLKADFENAWEECLRDSLQVDSIEQLKYRKRRNAIKAKQKIFNKLQTTVDFIYQKGIVENGSFLNRLSKKDDSLYTIYKSEGGNKYQLSEVFTEKNAYQYIKRELSAYSDSIAGIIIFSPRGVYNRLDLNKYLDPDLVYNEKVSSNVKQNLIDEVSKTKGMVQKGEKIISRGEVVTHDKYQELSSLEEFYKQKTGDSNILIFIGQFVFVLVAVLMLFIFLWNFRRDILKNSLKTTFILFLVLFFVSISSIIIRFDIVTVYIIPFALLPIIIRTFYDARLALFIHVVTILMIGFYAPNSFEFVFMNFTAGIVAIFSLTNLYHRGKLFLASAMVFITYSVVFLGISLVKEGSFIDIGWNNYMWFAFNGLLLLTSYPLIFIFEKIFGFLSDATLIELIDTNQPLLRALSEKAPGTFQHCMQVANLAEEGVRQIGGNALLVRAGALYHDIGKMERPSYYIENIEAVKNPHDNLDFEESAQIIISHVTKGVEMAQRHKLPAPLTDFIRTHHGTTTVQYFYRSFIKKYPEKEVDIDKFRYPGPKPYSKETAVLMMADSVEAASRSNKTLTDETINALVDNIIEHQVKGNQFDDANVTFKDISIIKGIFKMKLKKIFHNRIEYPEE
jgi:hypothetical protein